MSHKLRRLSFGIVLIVVLSLVVWVSVNAVDGPIERVSPANGETNVWVGQTMTIDFAVPMNHDTWKRTSASIRPSTGEFLWSEQPGGWERLEFLARTIPSHPRPNTRSALGAGIQDAGGEMVLDEPYTWSFATGESNHNALDFGSGLPVQLVDNSGQNAVRLWADYPRLQLDYTLYTLPLADFIPRYAALPDYSWMMEPIDVFGLEPAASWQDDYRSVEGQGDVTHLPDVPSGIYVLTVTHPHAGQAELYVIVSEHVLALKHAADGTLTAWANHLQTNELAAGMTLTAYGAEGETLATGTTDENGLAELAPLGETTPLLVVGEKAGDLTLTGLNGNWLNGGGYWYWWPADTWQDPNRVYLYTDRPIYRPGQTVNYAAILRQDNDGAYVPLDASIPVTLTVHDSRDNLVTTQALTPDDFGTANGSLTLAEEPPLGTYRMTLELEERSYWHSFEVDAYRKPEYQVEVTADASYVVAGDAISVTVAADYFFGQPVGGADVTLKVYRTLYS